MSPATTYEDRKALEKQLLTLTLKDLKVVEMRKLLSGLAITEVNSGDEVVKVHSAKKVDLLTTLEQIKTDLLGSDNEVQTEDVKTVRSEDLDLIVDRAYTDYMKGVTESFNVVKGVFGLPQPRVAISGNTAAFSIRSMKRFDTQQPIAPNTVYRYGSDVFNRVKDKIDNDKTPYRDQALEWFDLYFARSFWEGLEVDLEGKSSIKGIKRSSTKSLSKRQNHIRTVDVSEAIQWAKDTLERVLECSPNDDRVSKQSWPKWWDVSISLALVTGRRMIEIHTLDRNGSMCFAETDKDNHISFSNQAKVKGHKITREHFEKTPAYDIPTLLDPQLVLGAYERFSQLWPNRIYAHDDYLGVNQNIAVLISRELKQTDNPYSPIKNFGVKYLNVFEPDGTQTDLTSALFGKKKGLTYHHLRQIYAICAVKAFKPSGVRSNQYLSEILGQDRGSGATEATTASRYDGTDFELTEDSLVSLY